ncbi:MAG TPA: hypothetical protein VN200_04400 [Rhodoglobus sp.]|nr:hypothetical protein [Rhodoglobus sp.]
MPQESPFSPTIALVTVARDAEVRLAVALEPVGLTLRKFGILGRLVESTGLAPATLSRSVPDSDALVRGLIASGYVRSAGRPPQLTATEAGAAAYERAAVRVAAIDGDVFGSPAMQELAAVLAAMQPQPAPPAED